MGRYRHEKIRKLDSKLRNIPLTQFIDGFLLVDVDIRFNTFKLKNNRKDKGIWFLVLLDKWMTNPSLLAGYPSALVVTDVRIILDHSPLCLILPLSKNINLYLGSRSGGLWKRALKLYLKYVGKRKLFLIP